MIAYGLYCLFFFPRSRFFYILGVHGLAYCSVVTLKLLYADPRPFHVDTHIVPFGCFPDFGNPSGHALFAWVSSFTIFMDIFHSVPITFYYDGDSFYHEWCAYLSCLFFAVFWAFTIPFCRYIGAVHSMDQLWFGASMGFTIALWCHFILRDNLIWFFEKVILWQGESRGALNWGLIPQFTDPNK